MIDIAPNPKPISEYGDRTSFVLKSQVQSKKGAYQIF